ncbi:Flp pilus assembly protein CpaB [Pseudomonas sp. LS1212]|uniref:Flp pilus assembly protein CpaB n=1 Tax=Pseudomonas sp. LS1212 TaxID=2972478 RepID=UPI00215D3C0B|nr:Flp pilus assembly protein CpaB [Pseudomonas sp. LS1212]UVJ44578.1 Flp pilus assembly protein CpaB [Pseudomonas sp. LS1212]
MSSRLTMILAGFFLIGAIVVGYWGLVLSRPKPAPAAEVAAPAPASQPVAQTIAKATDELRKPVVVVRRDIPAYAVLTAEDLTVENLLVAPLGSFQNPDQVIGRTAWRALPAGTWLEQSSFEAGGPLARMIRPGERAVAVAVDEVIGAAGQLVPGDYVDVLLFLKQDASNPEQSAQVAIPALRLLSVGEQLGLANDGTPAVDMQSAAEKVRPEQLRSAGRTVVLAVPEALSSRLMLAAQAGTLRLAVRSAQEQRLARYWANEQSSAQELDIANRELYRLHQLAQAPAPRTPNFNVVAATPRPGGMEVIRGSQVTQQTP